MLTTKLKNVYVCTLSWYGGKIERKYIHKHKDNLITQHATTNSKTTTFNV